MNHLISLQQAQEMATRFRQQRENVLETTHKDQQILPLSETFEIAAITSLISQPGCTRLRIYYGMDDSLKVHAIIVGVNANDEDMLESSTSTTDPIIIEQSHRCPPTCPPNSLLNS